MRAIVADQLERARIVAGDEFDPGVALDLVGQVRKRAVERHGDRALGKRGRDALGDLDAGGAGGVLTARAVGEGQRDHVALHSLLPTNAGKRPDFGQFLNDRKRCVYPALLTVFQLESSGIRYSRALSRLRFNICLENI